MDLFQVIGLLDSDVVPDKCKIHLAGWNGSDDPLDVYLAGEFDEWQSWQTKRNFERPFVVSLISISRDTQWLFVGVYDSDGCEWIEEHGMNRYCLNKRTSASELEGRLIVRFERTGRQSYLLGENWSEQLKSWKSDLKKCRLLLFPDIPPQCSPSNI